MHSLCRLFSAALAVLHFFFLLLLTPQSIKCLEQLPPRTIKDTTLHQSGPVNRALLQTGRNESCEEDTMSWSTCVYNDCSLTIATQIYEIVFQRNCTQNIRTRLWDCLDISIESRAYNAIKYGLCRRSCSNEQASCRIDPRIESSEGVSIPSGLCPDGKFPSQYSCDCQLFNHTEMLTYTKNVFGHHGGCKPICTAMDQNLTACTTNRTPDAGNTTQSQCDTFICILNDCGALVTAAALNIIRNNSCTLSINTNMWECGNEVEVDEPGYTWVKQGECTPACGMIIAQNACVFTSRYGKHPEEWDMGNQTHTQSEEESEEKARKLIEESKEKAAENMKKERRKGKVLMTEPYFAQPSLPSEVDEEDDLEGKVMNNLEDYNPLLLPSTVPDATTETDIIQILDDVDSSPTPRPPTIPSPKQPSKGKIKSKPLHSIVIHESTATNVPEAVPSAVSPEISTEEDSSAGIIVTQDLDARSPLVSVSEVALPPEPSPPRPQTREIAAASVPQQSSAIQQSEVYTGPWLPCPQDCNVSDLGENIQERFVVCRSKISGIALPSDQCSSSEETPSRTCPQNETTTRDCGEKYVVRYGAWSGCSQSCPSSTKGERTRDFQCYEILADGLLVSAPKSKCSPKESSLRLACTPRLCDPVLYRTGEWKSCNCSSRLQKRSLSCVKINTRSTTKLEHCEASGLVRPRTSRNCSCTTSASSGRLLLQSTDKCAAITCSKHGTCNEGICSCHDGYSGKFCDQKHSLESPISLYSETELTSNRVDSDCPSEILDSSFNCCPRDSTLDRNGNCCVGELDACGKCNGTSTFVDALGKCCDTTLDASGICCESGNVDECGVCDGFGISCDFNLTFTISASPTDICVEKLISYILPLGTEAVEKGIRHAVEDEILTVLVPGSLIDASRTINFVEKSVRRRFSQFSSSSCNDDRLRFQSVNRKPVAGNGFCEIGEAIFIRSTAFEGIFAGNETWTSTLDCRFVIASCPVDKRTDGIGERNTPCSQRGLCVFAGQAQCHCFLGYQGDACNECEEGYAEKNDLCVRNNDSETAVNTEHSSLAEREENSRREQFVVIVGSIIAGLLVLIVVVFLLWSVHYHAWSYCVDSETNSVRGTTGYLPFGAPNSGPYDGLVGAIGSSNSSSGMSGAISFKREPSSIQPINRKSPSQMEIPYSGNFGEGPSSRPYLRPLRMSPPLSLYGDHFGRQANVPRQPLRSSSSDDIGLRTIQETTVSVNDLNFRDRPTTSLGFHEDSQEVTLYSLKTNDCEENRLRRYSTGHDAPSPHFQGDMSLNASVASLRECFSEEFINGGSSQVEQLPVSNREDMIDPYNTFEFSQISHDTAILAGEQSTPTGGRFTSFRDGSFSNETPPSQNFRSFLDPEFVPSTEPRSPIFASRSADNFDDLVGTPRSDEDGLVITPLEYSPVHSRSVSEPKHQVDLS